MLELKNKESISLLNNPFTKDNVDKITIDIYNIKLNSYRKFSVESTIRFQNGLTCGYHKIEAIDLEAALYQIKNLIDSL